MDPLAGASAGSSFSVAIARTIAASSGASSMLTASTSRDVAARNTRTRFSQRSA